jgi:hypothetical protein
VNWTMIMSSRRWQALHSLAEQPANRLLPGRAVSVLLPTGRDP